MTDDDEVAEVRQIWSALNLPGVIDVHTHFMPKSVMDKVWRYFDSAGPLVGREWPIAYRMAESERLHTLRQFGVRGFTARVYPHKPQMAAWLNQWALQFSRSTPDCLATATFYPEPDAGHYVDAAIHDLDSSRLDVALAALPDHSLRFQHGWADAAAEAAGGRAQAAVLLRPATVSQIASVAEGGMRMPPKTTFFAPKPRTGMVIRDLVD